MDPNRRAFLEAIAPLAALGWEHTTGSWPDVLSLSGLGGIRSGENKWRAHFPALKQRVNGHSLAYLDTAATSQRPDLVIRAVTDFCRHENANPGKALHTLARRASEAYEDARTTIARFINATDPLEVVFTRGTTEGVNLVATAWGGANLRPGDEVVLTIAEHASNLLPWQTAAKRAGATVRYLDVDTDGRLLLEQLDQLLSPRTKVFAFSHVSNVLGQINPAKELCARARAAGAMVFIDGAQSLPHFKVDVQDLGCDFLAFSGHKMMGPMGVGVLWGRRELLEAMPPYQLGSNMAHEVDHDSFELSESALKFGAGTPNVSGPVGLAAAIRFIEHIGHDAMWQHEQDLTRHALTLLTEVPGVRLLGAPMAERRIAVFPLVVDGVAVPEVVARLDDFGIAVRGGDLAALPLLKRLGVTRAVRASLYIYSTRTEVDRLADGLRRIARP